MNRKYSKINEVIKNLQWLLITTKQNRELFHDGIDLEIIDMATKSLSLLVNYKKEKGEE